MKIKVPRIKIQVLFIMFTVVVMFALNGCDENGGILIPSGSTELSINMKSDDNASDNPIDAVIVTEAKALITDIQYERERDGRDQLHHTGPFIINFTFDGSLKELHIGYIVRDIYTKVKFLLHKPGENETVADPEFKTGTAENQRFSVIIKGTYNGSPFTYRSQQELSISTGFNKSTNINSPSQNVTVVLNRTGWFKNGAAVLNPNLPGNAPIIDSNIADSFIQAFLDDNKDGQPD